MNIGKILHVFLDLVLAFILGGATLILGSVTVHQISGKTHSGTVVATYRSVNSYSYDVRLQDDPQKVVHLDDGCVRYCVQGHGIGDQVRVRIGSDGSAVFAGFLGGFTEMAVFTLLCAFLTYLSIWYAISNARRRKAAA